MKKTVILLTLITSSFAWAAGCVSGNCIDGFGKYEWDDGSFYHGQFKDELQNGKGTYRYESGYVYSGSFLNGQRNGKGKSLYLSGDSYVGDWYYDKMNGEGIYTWNNGNTHVGTYVNGVRSGKGTYTDVSTNTPNVNQGIWLNDSFIGTEEEINAVEMKKKSDEKAAKRQKQIEENTRKAIKEAIEKKYTKIYNACLIDKSSDVDMQVYSINEAVIQTCEAIASDPSWFENAKYNLL
tara:strand:+ start:123 stop:833 length:711 start_codon:yes stop_codon:yes gene_type:complete